MGDVRMVALFRQNLRVQQCTTLRVVKLQCHLRPPQKKTKTKTEQNRNKNTVLFWFSQFSNY